MTEKTRRAVGMLVFSEKKLLLVKKQKNSSRVSVFSPHWDIPKGGIFKDELPIEAVFRELSEELSINASEVLAMEDLGVTIRFKFPPGSQYLDQETSVYRLEICPLSARKIDLSSELSDYTFIDPALGLDLLPENETKQVLMRILNP